MHAAIGRFLRYLSAERNASPLTIKSYREDLTLLVDWFEQQFGRTPDPKKLSPQDLRAYVAALHEAGYAKGTVARRLASMRSFFKFVMREGGVDANPAKPLRNPRGERKLPHFLTGEEIQRLLEAPPKDEPAGLRDRAILETMYSAGLRVSEAVGLNDEDLDWDQRLLHVYGKGKKERLAPLGSYAIRALESWLAVRELSAEAQVDGVTPVFVNRFGDRLTTRSVGRMLEKYIQQSGLDGRTSPHTLRHSFATHLVQNSADIRSVQQMLGHADISTTQVYTHITDTHLRKTYEKFHPRAKANSGIEEND